MLTLEQLELRLPLAVNLIDVGTPLDFVRLQVVSGGSGSEDRESLSDVTFPISLNRPLSVPEATSGTAAAYLNGSATLQVDNSLSNIDLTFRGTGQGVDGPGVNRSLVNGNLAVSFEVTDEPVEVSVTGSVSSISTSDFDIARLVLATGGGLSQGVNQFTPIVGQGTRPFTFQPITVAVNERVTLDPGVYYVGLGIGANVRNPNVAGDSQIDVRVEFGPQDVGLDLEPIQDKTVNVGEALSFGATTSGGAGAVSYSLDSASQAAGMTMDPATGEFSWTPTTSQSPGIYDVTVTAMDESTPPVTDSESFTITVTDVYHWAVGGVGDYGQPSNWDPMQVPGSTATVYFDLPAAYQVVVGDRSVERAIIGGDPSAVVTFVNGNLQAQSTSPTSPGVVVDNGQFVLQSGTLSSNFATIGAGAVSDAKITGAASIFENSGRLTVGAGGEATLRIEDSGQVTSAETRIGDAANDTFGWIVVTDQASKLNAGSLGVGFATQGILDVLSGAEVEAVEVVVGAAAGGSGIVTVDGDAGDAAFSSLRVDEELYLGGKLQDGGGGPGELRVSAGARVAADSVILGVFEPGVVTVIGSGTNGPSELLAGDLNVGALNVGTMTVAEGGSVVAFGETIVGAEFPGRITVDGSSSGHFSQFLTDQDVSLGATSQGILEVLGGGKAQMRHLQVATGDGGSGEVTVRGEVGDGLSFEPSTLNVEGDVVLGGDETLSPHSAGPSALNIQAGGNVTVGSGLIAGAFGASTINVEGAGFAGLGPSSLRVTSSSFVGEDADATLNVTEGAEVWFEQDLKVGGPGGRGDVTVDGSEPNGGGLSLLQTENLILGGPTGQPVATLTTSDGAVTRVLNTLTVNDTGTLDARTGAVLVGDLNQIPVTGQVRIGTGGTLNGTGTIQGGIDENGGVNNFAGNVQPGSSPGVLTIVGNYTQGPGGTLEIEVTGPAPGSQYDQLVVSGDVVIDGSVKIVFDGYVPALDEKFQFLVANSIAGQFGKTIVEGLPLGLRVELDAVSGNIAVMTSRPGDLNGDDAIDVADVDLLCDALRKGDDRYDLNGDALVDPSDVDFLIRDILGTYPGDANLDGVFNSADLIQVLEAGEYEDTVAENSTWAEGDWNCDGEFDSGDLVTALQAGGYSATVRPRPAAMPSADQVDAVIALTTEDTEITKRHWQLRGGRTSV